MPIIQYRVRSGDTLYELSKRHNVTLEELCSLNQIRDANLIFVGQVLQIPIRQRPNPLPGRRASSALSNLPPSDREK